MVIMRWARNSEGTWWHAVLATICEIKYKSGIAEYVVTGDVFYVHMYVYKHIRTVCDIWL
jgi:hypothetical protein